jgi:hypothetical protein
MKFLKIELIILALISWSFVACDREAELTPTGLENVYGDPTLPQGNHDYDQRIVNMFEKYNTLFLYEYLPHDLYFSGTRWTGGTYDPVLDTTYQHNGNQDFMGYFDVPADQRYIGKQLDLLHEVWLDFYPEKYLEQCLPKKVFLLDSLYWSRAKKGRPNVNYTPVYTGGDFMAVTWGREAILQITPAEKTAFRDALNAAFLSVAVTRKGAIMPESFKVVSTYTGVNIRQDYNKLGLIDPSVTDAPKDWLSFMATIVSIPYSQLISPVGPGNYLHESFDENGLVRKKYDIVINYFLTEQNVDLQRIGNTVF